VVKDNLNITLIQSDLHWENREENLRMFSEKIKNIAQTDLILLPEMFSTGFSMNPEQFAETMDGRALQWMKETSKEKNCVLCGSLMMHANNHFYNRLIWMKPDGSFVIYDKKHLFGLGEEHNHYSPGNKKLIVELNGWKICVLICFDLRFPAWSRNLEDYDLLIYVASWPERRIEAWKKLLPARAIENQCYVAAVNRVGDDGDHIYHSGSSTVIDPLGNPIWQAEQEETIQTVSLSHDMLNKIRDRFPFLKDRDRFEIL
jgi:omega-amidase